MKIPESDPIDDLNFKVFESSDRKVKTHSCSIAKKTIILLYD